VSPAAAGTGVGAALRMRLKNPIIGTERLSRE